MKCRMLVLIGLLALIAGCEAVTEKVVWSPDGKRAAVFTPDGLALCDAEGKLSPPMPGTMTQVAWTPDSQRLVIVRQKNAATWDEAATLLEEGQVRDLIADAKKFKEELLAYQGALEKFEPKSFKRASSAWGSLMFLYLRDKLPDGLPEKMGDMWAGSKDLTVAIFQIEVGDVSDGGVKFLPHLVRMFESPCGLRVSPDGKTVAYAAEPPMVRSEGLNLFVLPLAGGTPREVAQRVSRFPDWLPDGRSLVYACTVTPWPESGPDLRLGFIVCREVSGADGALLESFGKAEELARLVFDGGLKVRALSDGRILFATTPATFPCTEGVKDKKGNLYVLEPPGKVTPVPPPAVLASLPEGVDRFAVSPDQKRVLIQGEAGLTIVALADGHIEATIAESQKNLMLLPVWRSAEEVCLAVDEGSKLGSPKRPEVVLWSPTGTKVLSKTWPDSLVKRMLKPAKEEKKEAAPPQDSTPPKEPAPAKAP